VSIPADKSLGDLLERYGYDVLAREIRCEVHDLRALAAGTDRPRPWALLYRVASAKGWRVVLGGFSPSVEELNELWEAARPE